MSAVDERPAGWASRGALWFGLLGGAVAWTAHLMLAYLIGEFGCLTETGNRVYLGLTVVSWLVLAASAVTLAVAAAAAGVAYRNRGDQGDTDGNGRSAVADAGVVASGLFTLVIVVETLPILYYLRDC